MQTQALDRTIKKASVVVLESSTMTLVGSRFKENVGGNGVISMFASNATVERTTFEYNAASVQQLAAIQDGGIGRRSLAETTPDQTLHEHSTTIALWFGSVANLAYTSFVNNGGTSAGALFATDGGTKLFLRSVEFLANQAVRSDFAAGAVAVTDGAVASIADATFDGNHAQSQWSAGAIYVNLGSVVINTASFVNNAAHAHPYAGTWAGSGVLYADESAVQIDNATIFDNEATGDTDLTASNYADALYLVLPQEIIVRDSTFEPILDGGKTVAINPGSIAGVTQGGCIQHPCPKGSSCEYANYSITCTPCQGMTYSSDVSYRTPPYGHLTSALRPLARVRTSCHARRA